MKKSFIFSLKILLFGFILPFKIWQFSKERLFSKADNKSITSLLDEDYVATSWFDLMIDAIIFLIYPVGLLLLIMVNIFVNTHIAFSFFLLIPLYFITLIISLVRELGGSLMLLHLNIKKIRDLLEDNESKSN